jgi:hypothetical protein
VRDCRTVSSYENRVVGYDVVYEYHGQRYTTRTATDPARAWRSTSARRGAPADYDDGAARGGYRRVPPAYASARTTGAPRLPVPPAPYSP